MNKNSRLIKLLRFTLTFSIVSIAFFLALTLWHNYMNSPWTRDGRVRADVVTVAPDVGGMVSKVEVKDNQYVHRGETLFTIDEQRFSNDLKELQALAQTKQVEYYMKQRQAKRRESVGDEVVSSENRDDAILAVSLAKAEYDKALAQVENAKLNLNRTKVVAPTDGWVSNLLLKQGDYIKAGENRLALIDSNSFWVYGYFEEHKLQMINIGDPVIMNPLGTNCEIKGHIESIAQGIADRDNVTGERLLANVNPIFAWVRLAQRIPVRIHIDSVPANIKLVAGMTCSVSVKPSDTKTKQQPLH